MEWARNAEQIGVSAGTSKHFSPGGESGRMKRSPDKAARWSRRERDGAQVCALTQQKPNSIFTLIKSAAINVPVSASGRYCGSDVLHSRTSRAAAISPVLQGPASSQDAAIPRRFNGPVQHRFKALDSVSEERRLRLGGADVIGWGAIMALALPGG